MKALLCFAAVAIILAGCASPDVTPTSTSPPPPPAPAFTRVETVVDRAGGQGEPSLGVTPDGTLWTNGLGNKGPAGTVIGSDIGSAYYSKNGGLNWTKVAPGVMTDDLDPDLAVDVDGTVWFDTLWIGCTGVSVSRDNGQNWDNTAAACNVPGDDRQYLIPTKGGTAYLYSHQLPSFYQTGSKTTDYGKTWVPMGPMETPDHFLLANGGTGWGGGGFWNAKTGSVFATFTTNTQAGDALPGYTVTKDGLTWTQGAAASKATGQALGLGLVTGAADDAGNIYISWGSADGKDVGIYVAGSKDDGATWTAPLRIDAPAGSKAYPAIAAGAAGKVAIAYYEADKAGFPDAVPKDAHWNVTLQWTDDFWANATWQSHPFSTAPVRKGPICTSGSGCGANREFLDYFALERLPDGRVGSIWCKGDPGKPVLNVFGMTEEPLLGARLVAAA